MNSGASISKHYNKFISLLEMNRRNFLEKLNTEEHFIKSVIQDDDQLYSWAFHIGAMKSHKVCECCGAVMYIKDRDERNEIWVCTSKKKDCKRFRIDENFRFNMDKPMYKLIGLLYLWYRQQDPEELISENEITPQEYEDMHETLIEACIMKCRRDSRRIGGFKVSVNVEIGRRGGLGDNKNVAICGVCPDDHTQYFFYVFPNDNPSYLEVRHCLKFWLMPGTNVFTNSDGYEFIKDMKWNIKPEWSLIINSKCLARDVWLHVHQQLDNTFGHFIKDTLDYFNY